MQTIRILTVVALIASMLAPFSVGDAWEFRQLNRIRTPGATTATEPGFQAVNPPILIPRALMVAEIEKMARAWNSGEFAEFLGTSFFEGQRLLDTIRADVPRDATLRVLGLQGVETLSQRQKPLGLGLHLVRSEVSSRLRMQIEFTDPATGFRRIDADCDCIFDVELTVRATP